MTQQTDKRQPLYCFSEGWQDDSDLKIKPPVKTSDLNIAQLDHANDQFFELPICFDLLTGFYNMHSAHSVCIKRKVSMVTVLDMLEIRLFYQVKR